MEPPLRVGSPAKGRSGVGGPVPIWGLGAAAQGSFKRPPSASKSLADRTDGYVEHGHPACIRPEALSNVNIHAVTLQTCQKFNSLCVQMLDSKTSDMLTHCFINQQRGTSGASSAKAGDPMDFRVGLGSLNASLAWFGILVSILLRSLNTPINVH